MSLFLFSSHWYIITNPILLMKQSHRVGRKDVSVYITWDRIQSSCGSGRPTSGSTVWFCLLYNLYLYLYPNSHPEKGTSVSECPRLKTRLSSTRVFQDWVAKEVLNVWSLKSHILGKNWATQHLHKLQVWRPQLSYKNKYDKFVHQVVSLGPLCTTWWPLDDNLTTTWW